MKKNLAFFYGCMFIFVICDANSARPSLSEKMLSAPRAGVMSKQQISAQALMNSGDSVVVSKPSLKAGDVNANVQINPDEMLSVNKDMREKERMACINNNIGVTNTFVWASRYSDTSNYATMVEDVEQPENNTCFVKTALKSNDPKINVSNIPAKYFEIGQVVTCGDWADYDTLKQYILDVKKKGRTLGTVASVVAGAGLGVGAMELFGNEMIGGNVEGQYNENLSETQLLRSQLLTLKNENEAQYKSFINNLAELKKKCDDYKNTYAIAADADMPSACIKYKGLFSLK